MSAPREFTIAITGDSAINRRISVHDDERFLALVKAIRDADVGLTHLETLIHDYDGPEVYPAAESGGTHMRSPRFVPEELRWMGFDMVSLAGNHALDYSYGGLYATSKALDDAGLVHAGTGSNLGDARAPAYLETPKGRVALISMCSSFSGWARAGQVRPDVKGRPGVNPLRYHYVVDAETMKQARDFFAKLGYNQRWYEQSRMLLISPPGLNLTTTRFIQGDQPGVVTAVDEDDAEGNLRSIRDARRQADWVIVHLHNHSLYFDAGKGYFTPARYVPPFAHACIDAGADVFIDQGADLMPLAGIEVYKNKPIIYNPGGLIKMNYTICRLPADFYLWPGYPETVRSWKATPADAYDAREGLPKSAATGLPGAPVSNAVVSVCSFGDDGSLKAMKLYPVTHTKSPRSQKGVPLLADPKTASKLFEYLARVSSAFGTKIEIADGMARVDTGKTSSRGWGLVPLPVAPRM